MPMKLIPKNHPLLEYQSIRIKNDSLIYNTAKAIDNPRTIRKKTEQPVTTEKNTRAYDKIST